MNLNNNSNDKVQHFCDFLQHTTHVNPILVKQMELVTNHLSAVQDMSVIVAYVEVEMNVK